MYCFFQDPWRRIWPSGQVLVHIAIGSSSQLKLPQDCPYQVGSGSQRRGGSDHSLGSIMVEGLVLLDREEQAVVEQSVATVEGGTISLRSLFGGDFSSPEHAASPSDSSSTQLGVCVLMWISFGAGGGPSSKGSLSLLPGSASIWESISMSISALGSSYSSPPSRLLRSVDPACPVSLANDSFSSAVCSAVDRREF